MALPYTLVLTETSRTPGADGGGTWTATVPAARNRGSTDLALNSSSSFRRFLILIGLMSEGRFTEELEDASCTFQDTDGNVLAGPYTFADQFDSNSYSLNFNAAEAVAVHGSSTLQLHFEEPKVAFGGRGTAAVEGTAAALVNYPAEGKGSAEVTGEATALVNYPAEGKGSAEVTGEATLDVVWFFGGRGSAALVTERDWAVAIPTLPPGETIPSG